jgi:hypothetical protein
VWPHPAPDECPLGLRPWCDFLLPQAETRAEFAERTVAKLEKTIDDLEGRELSPPCVCLSVCLSDGQGCL